jgi:hypothetical protein
MNEYIRTIFLRNEPVAFLAAKPLNDTYDTIGHCFLSPYKNLLNKTVTVHWHLIRQNDPTHAPSRSYYFVLRYHLRILLAASIHEFIPIDKIVNPVKGNPLPRSLPHFSPKNGGGKGEDVGEGFPSE